MRQTLRKTMHFSSRRTHVELIPSKYLFGVSHDVAKRFSLNCSVKGPSSNAVCFVLVGITVSEQTILCRIDSPLCTVAAFNHRKAKKNVVDHPEVKFVNNKSHQ